MPWAKTKTLPKQEASRAKEEQLQIAVLAYQTALKSNKIMSIQQVAQHFQVPVAPSSIALMAIDQSLGSMPRSHGWLMRRVEC